MPAIFTKIPLYNLPVLLERVDDLNKRAAKLGLPALEVKTAGEDVVEVREHPVTNARYKVVFRPIILSGESPKLNGWKLVGKVEPMHDDPTKKLLKSVPGETCPEEFRDVEMGRCDHCHTSRLRNATFVVGHDDGAFKVVGRNCLADFLGHASAESLIAAAETVFTLDDFVRELTEESFGCCGFGLGSRHREIPTELFAGTVNLFIKEFGWVSRTAAMNEPERFVATADMVWDFLTPRTDADRRRREEMCKLHNLKVDENDDKLVLDALNWVRNLDAKDSDYLINLKVACSAETVSWNTHGLVASLVNTYKRHLEFEIRKRLEREGKTRGHVGVVKERRGFPSLTVLRTHNFESEYGLKTLVTFEDAAGNLIKWFACGDMSEDYEMGSVVDVTATVTKHGAFRGENETAVNRVSLGIDETKFSLFTGEPLSKVEAAAARKLVKLRLKTWKEVFSDELVELSAISEDMTASLEKHLKKCVSNADFKAMTLKVEKLLSEERERFAEAAALELEKVYGTPF